MENQEIFAWLVHEWARIDSQLCRLVDRLRARGYHRTLKAELRLMKVRSDPGKYEFTKFLPEFREKGVVTIVDGAHGNLLHSSTHNR